MGRNENAHRQLRRRWRTRKPWDPFCLLLAGIASLNMLVLNFPVNSGSGVKLGQAITILALHIQGPFTEEDTADNQEHRRQVQSTMLNVFSDSKITSIVEAGL